MIAARFLAPLCAVLFSLAVFAADKPDFSGTWQIDTAKSSMGNAPPPQKMIRKISQQGDLISTQTTTGSPNGDITNDSRFVADGRTETVNKTRFGDAKSTATWKGEALEIKTNLEVQGMSISSLETWTLSSDAKTLSIRGAITTPQGAIDTNIVMNRQPRDTVK